MSAGRDSTWRRRAAAAAADDAGGAGMEAQVVPLELYDSARAKIDANLRWLFAIAYGIGKASTISHVNICIGAKQYAVHEWVQSPAV